MSHGKFATAINCMDGRTQSPVSEWMKSKFGVDYVDTVTEPGPDWIMSQGIADGIESIKKRVLISVGKHGSRVVAVVGHHDCAGNPGSKEEHFAHVRESMEVVKSWGLDVKVYGVWVNKEWKLEEIGSL